MRKRAKQPNPHSLLIFMFPHHDWHSVTRTCQEGVWLKFHGDIYALVLLLLPPLFWQMALHFITYAAICLGCFSTPPWKTFHFPLFPSFYIKALAWRRHQAKANIQSGTVLTFCLRIEGLLACVIRWLDIFLHQLSFYMLNTAQVTQPWPGAVLSLSLALNF